LFDNCLDSLVLGMFWRRPRIGLGNICYQLHGCGSL
jgi:hypothetical protein